MKRIMQQVVVVCILAVLAACSGGHKPHASQYANANNRNLVVRDESMPSAQTIGVEEQHAFSERRAKSLRQAAPADQTYYFAFDDSNVNRDNVTSINLQADYLLHHAGARIRLEGHTDERGSREYNVALGWRRAKAVARIMKQLGVSTKQLVVVSYGKERPVAFGANEEAWHKNRRVQLVYERR